MHFVSKTTHIFASLIVLFVLFAPGAASAEAYERYLEALGELPPTDLSESVLERADAAHVAVENATVIPREAFLSALGETYPEEVPVDVFRMALQESLQDQLSGANAVGGLVYQSELSVFDDDLFLVPLDARRLDTGEIVFTKFFVAAVPLKGDASWVGSEFTVLAALPPSNEKCCDCMDDSGDDYPGDPGGATGGDDGCDPTMYCPPIYVDFADLPVFTAVMETVEEFQSLFAVETVSVGEITFPVFKAPIQDECDACPGPEADKRPEMCD